MTLPADLTRYTRDPAGFCDDFMRLNEKGQPWRLSGYQRRALQLAFRWDALGHLLIRTLLWSEMKKSGKTFLAAALGLWWAFVNPRTEVIVCANDLDQSVGRVFSTMAALCTYNPALSGSTKVRAEEIFVSNGTVITAIAADWKGSAGSRHSLAIFDELFAFTTEGAQRLYEELTPPPTEANAWTLIVTYAGWTGESILLEKLYTRGLGGQRLDGDLEVFLAGQLLMFWSHTPRQPWLTPAYYADQRDTLRPATYLRIHENRWVSGEAAFLTPELWDRIVDPEARPLLPTRDRRIFSGVDVGIKHDTGAVVSVEWRADALAIVGHRIWRPTPSDPLDLEGTVESYLREWHHGYALETVLCDPYQMHRSMTTLRAAGLPVEEFPQTTPNLTAIGQTLWDLLNGRNLRAYPAADLREQVLNAVAVETARGWRLAKDKASKKIDAAVALAMACYAAVRAGRPVAPVDVGVEPDVIRAERPGLLGARADEHESAGAMREGGGRAAFWTRGNPERFWR